MKRVITDFYRSQVWLIIRYSVIVFICIGAFIFTDIYENEKTKTAGIAVTVFLGAVYLISVGEIFITAPMRLKKRLGELSEKEREAFPEEYEKAKRVGKRYFMEESFLFYSYRRIELLKYSEIRSLRLKNYNLFITPENGQKVIMQFEPKEEPALIMAYLCGKNSKIRVEGTEKRK